MKYVWFCNLGTPTHIYVALMDLSFTEYTANVSFIYIYFLGDKNKVCYVFYKQIAVSLKICDEALQIALW